MQRYLFLALSAIYMRPNHVDGFYLPGVSPISFKEGDPVPLKVNKMTSQKTLMPVEYYRLPFCKPKDGVKMENENLGEFLAGDRIENSPYELYMKQDMYCQQLCVTQLGRSEKKGTSNNKMVRAIRKEYHNNWILDNLPAAGIMNEKEGPIYFQGFPVGFQQTEAPYKSYINNHVNIEVHYHTVETETDSYRIVRFIVEPFSIKHEIDDIDTMDDDEDAGDEGGEKKKSVKIVDIRNPIRSCDPGKSEKHTTQEMILDGQHFMQEASGDVLFTYDVKWIENKELHWASRWDIYLSMNNMVKPQVHWYSITNSILVVVVLTSMISAILVRNLRRDFTRYNRLATDEEKSEELEEFGWKLVHADVFRPPSYPMVLAIACGTGLQITMMAFVTIIFSAIGFLNPSNRGSLLMGVLLCFVLFGGANGYTTARLYKTFKGKAWQRATTLAAVSFPGLCFGIFIIMDILAITQNSSDAVPFTTILVLLVLWFGISTPLVFLGSYFGYKQDAIEFPVNTSNIPRQIPDQPWFMSDNFAVFTGGALPFGACFVELYFIMSSVWMDEYYYVFGFLFLVFLILLITTVEIAFLFNYFQLCAENYHWWWRSFFTAGSVGLYMLCYSVVYFKNLHTNTFSTYLLYFGYMFLASITMVIMTGSVGLLSCLFFNKTIYGSIKID